MILEEETYKKFGYYPHTLKPQSHKLILAKCDGCDIIRETSKHDYRNFCKLCALKRTNKLRKYSKGELNPNWRGER